MSLFDDASVVITPSGYKEGKLYSIKPTDGSGDLSVTRATTATRVNSAGLIEVVPYNLLQRSEQFDNVIWVKSGLTITANSFTAPNGTLTADTITPSISDASLRQSFLPTGAVQYTFSVWLRSATGSNFSTSLRCWRDSPFTNVANTVINVTTEWQRFTFTFTSLDSSSHTIAIGGSSTLSTGENCYIWGAQLVEGTSAKDYLRTETRLNIPRLDYTNGSCPSILVEPQRTNLYLRSEEFDNSSWAKVAATVTANATTSPSGNLTAEKLIATAASSTHLIVQQPAGAVNGTTATVSIFAKASELSRIQLLNNGGGFGVANFNLSAGTAALVSGVSASIENFGNGWYRCIMSYIPTITGNFNIQVRLADNSGNTTFLGNGTDGLFIYGAQIEAGSNATSYIFTTSASVTRNADVISKTGISSLIGQTEGTLLLNLNLKAYSSVTALFTLSDGTSSNRLRSRRTGVNSIELERNLTGQPNKGLTFTSAPSSGLVKVCFTWASTTNGLAIYVNGTKLALNEAIPTFTNQLTQFNLGSLQDGSSSLNDSINLATIWKTKLTDAECIQLTTI
jgi:hypothetical protein